MLKFTEIGILADDLTGACDAAACFAPGNGPVAVIVSRGAGAPSADGAVINTQSRLLEPVEVRAALRAVGRELSGKPVIYKKIDAALRGPVGAELEGLLEGTGKRTLIVAPAIPRIGRTTKDGVIYDSGVPIDRTSYARDSASPVDSASILEILGKTGFVQCEIPDADTDEDMRRIVERSLQKAPVIFAGSLGLADALARMVEARPWTADLPSAHRAAVVCGSFYPRSRDQIKTAADRFGASVIEIDETTCPDPSLISGERGKPVFIMMIQKHSGRNRMHAEFVNTITSRISGLIRNVRPDGLGIIGGETAFHLLRALDTTRLAVYGRIEEVITFGAISDGILAGSRFVTKGGSVGPEDAVVRMIHHLTGTVA